jgi:hypothetical protein
LAGTHEAGQAAFYQISYHGSQLFIDLGFFCQFMYLHLFASLSG